jgi:hypothetical protein
MKYYWEEAVRNWGKGVKPEYWSKRDTDPRWRMRMEIYSAAARWI